jgi:hypothetical protein
VIELKFDVATTVGDHHRYECLRQQDRADDVHIEDLPHLLSGRMQEILVLLDGRVIDQRGALRRECHECCDLSRVGDIGDSTAATNLGSRGGDLLGIDINGEHVVPVTDKSHGNGLADALAGSGDYRGSAITHAAAPIDEAEQLLH